MFGGFVWPVCELDFVVVSGFIIQVSRPDADPPRPADPGGPGGGAPAPPPPARCESGLRARPRTADRLEVPLSVNCPLSHVATGSGTALTPAGAAAGLFETMSFQSTRPRR